MMLAVLDYGAGNLTSVRKALAAVGADVSSPRAPSDLQAASAVIVPGVGNFGATEILDEAWRDAIRRLVRAGRPLLGICLGMQWLFEGSAEAPGLIGLGLVSGRCERLGQAEAGPHEPSRAGAGPGAGRTEQALKVPHVGWNALSILRSSWILHRIPDGAQFYFTHSYAAPVTPDCVATTTHGAVFAAAVERGHVAGVQFHPEKSGDAGLQVLRNFVLRARTGNQEPRTWNRTGNQEPGTVNRCPAMLSKRLIACLDVRHGRVVKGVAFEGLRDAGDPAALARRYNAEGVDEIVLLDVTATAEGRRARAATIAAVAREIFIPLAVGGGIRTEDDASAAIEAGADKVSLNTAAVEDPSIIARIAARYGSQAVVVAIDAKREGGRFAVYTRSGAVAARRDAVEWAREAAERGAGEILLTSIDRDGTKQGFDCDLTAAVSSAVQIPVIASGGAGTFEHFAQVFTEGRADAALAASVFHYAEHGVRELKVSLRTRGIPVRL